MSVDVLESVSGVFNGKSWRGIADKKISKCLQRELPITLNIYSYPGWPGSFQLNFIFICGTSISLILW